MVEKLEIPELRPRLNTHLNQVILWDKVVESAEEAHLIEKDMTVKYGLIDEVRIPMPPLWFERSCRLGPADCSCLSS